MRTVDVQCVDLKLDEHGIFSALDACEAVCCMTKQDALQRFRNLERRQANDEFCVQSDPEPECETVSLTLRQVVSQPNWCQKWCSGSLCRFDVCISTFLEKHGVPLRLVSVQFASLRV